MTHEPFPNLVQFILASVLIVGAITLAIISVSASKTPLAGDSH